MSAPVNRRDFLKAGGAMVASAAAAALGGITAASPQPAVAAPAETKGNRAGLPKTRGPRVVVIGGGTGGLTLAKYLKKENSRFDVVLVEKRALYTSCFFSNLWYADLVNLEFLAHSFLDAAKNGGYTFFNATCVGADRSARKVFTDQGEIDYDYLVLSPGIDYDYAKIGVTDPDTEFRLRSEYPAGWMLGTEHGTIKRKIREFEGGVFIQTVPSGNYRCLPAPYERACMIASVFKKNKIKGKVLVLDHNPDITIKAQGFHAAFEELFKGIVEYVPSAEIKSVDVEKKTINTTFDSYKFDEAAIYPNVRASRLIETIGITDPTSPQKEAHIDPFKYHVPGDQRVYVIGDSRPQPFSKSANTANTEAKFVAKVIAAHAAGKDIEWASPHTTCFSMVNAAPAEAISVDAGYAFDAKTKAFGFANVKMDQERNTAKGQATFEWARGLYRDMFGT